MPDNSSYIIPININKQKVYKNKYIYINVSKFGLDSADMLVSVWSPQACWSGACLSPMGKAVSDGTCRSPMEYVGIQ